MNEKFTLKEIKLILFAMEYLDSELPECDSVLRKLDTMLAAPTVQEGPVGWQFYQDGKWWYGDDRIKVHRKNTEAAGIPVRDVYAAPQPAEQQPAPDMTPWEELDFSKMTRRQLVVYSGQQNFKITHLQAHNEHLNAKVRRQKDALRQIERKPTPDVAALVEALELAHMALIGYLPGHRNKITDAAISHCEQALATHRNQGGDA